MDSTALQGFSSIDPGVLKQMTASFHDPAQGNPLTAGTFQHLGMGYNNPTWMTGTFQNPGNSYNAATTQNPVREKQVQFGGQNYWTVPSAWGLNEGAQHLTPDLAKQYGGSQLPSGDYIFNYDVGKELPTGIKTPGAYTPGVSGKEKTMEAVMGLGTVAGSVLGGAALGGAFGGMGGAASGAGGAGAGYAGGSSAVPSALNQSLLGGMANTGMSTAGIAGTNIGATAGIGDLAAGGLGGLSAQEAAAQFAANHGYGGMYGGALQGAPGAEGTAYGAVPQDIASSSLGQNIITGPGGTAAGVGGAGGAGNISLGGVLSQFIPQTNAQVAMLGLGGVSALTRLLQGKKLEDIARQSSSMANPMNQPQRQPAQQNVNSFLTGGQDITKTPLMQSSLALSDARTKAQLAAMGLTNTGAAPRIYNENFANLLNQNVPNYLNTLGMLGGFNQGPGYAGNLYGQYAAQSTGALPLALNNISQGLFQNPADQSTANQWLLAQMANMNNPNRYGTA